MVGESEHSRSLCGRKKRKEKKEKRLTTQLAQQYTRVGVCPLISARNPACSGQDCALFQPAPPPPPPFLHRRA